MAIVYKGGEKDGQIEYVGCVLTPVYEKYCGFDVYMDYCECWNGKEVCIVAVGHGYCTMTTAVAVSTMDATPEVLALVKAWRNEKERKNNAIRRANEIIQMSKTVRRGDKLIVKKGRKHPIGLLGEVFWAGPTQYGISVGFRVTGSTEAKWVPMKNVEKVLTEEEEKELKEAQELVCA